MNILTVIFASCAVLGILDAITGNHLKLGTEFEKGLQLVGTLTLSMLGMICLVPLISTILSPVILPLSDFLHLDPSIFSAMLIANDMGGAALSAGLAADTQMGLYNGLVVSSMMGATVSFTIPTALKLIPQEQHKDAMTGILCGVCTIPVGCIVAGLIASVPVLPLLIDMVPVTTFALVIALGLWKAPRLSVRLLTVFGKLLYALIMIGLALALFDFLTGITILKGLAPAKDSFEMLFTLAFLLSGVFPLIKILSSLLQKPLGHISKALGINEVSALGLLTALASSAPTLGLVKDMNRKGVILNLAFAVSAAFALGDHLAFTLLFDSTYTLPVIVGKLTAGAAALIVAFFVYKRICKEEASEQKTASEV